MFNVKEAAAETSQIGEALANLNIDVEATLGQEIQQDKFDFYTGRFQMFEDDGAPLAINAYLMLLGKDKDVNEYTRLLIYKYATESMCGSKHEFLT